MASTAKMTAAGGAVANVESSGFVEFFGYHATAGGWFDRAEYGA